MDIEETQGEAVVTPYMPMGGQQQRGSSNERLHYLVHAVMSAVIGVMIGALFIVIISHHHGGTAIEVEFSRDSVESHLDAGHFAAFISVDSPDITVAASSSLKDHRGRALYQVEGGLSVTYSLKNNGHEDVFVITKQTPLEEGDDGQPRENFLGSSKKMYYTGVITEASCPVVATMKKR